MESKGMEGDFNAEKQWTQEGVQTPGAQGGLRKSSLDIYAVFTLRLRVTKNPPPSRNKGDFTD